MLYSSKKIDSIGAQLLTMLPFIIPHYVNNIASTCLENKYDVRLYPCMDITASEANQERCIATTPYDILFSIIICSLVIHYNYMSNVVLYKYFFTICSQ